MTYHGKERKIEPYNSELANHAIRSLPVTPKEAKLIFNFQDIRRPLSQEDEPAYLSLCEKSNVTPYSAVSFIYSVDEKRFTPIYIANKGIFIPRTETYGPIVRVKPEGADLADDFRDATLEKRSPEAITTVSNGIVKNNRPQAIKVVLGSQTKKDFKFTEEMSGYRTFADEGLLDNLLKTGYNLVQARVSLLSEIDPGTCDIASICTLEIDTTSKLECGVDGLKLSYSEYSFKKDPDHEKILAWFDELKEGKRI